MKIYTSKQINFEGLANELLGTLPDRSQDVIVRRFGIGDKDFETLESIGQTYNITRERVRQIESESLRQLRALHEQKEALDFIYNEMVSFIEKHGGLMREDHLLTRFVEQQAGDNERHEGLVLLFLELGPHFECNRETDHYHTHWLTDREAYQRAHALVQKLVTSFRKSRRLLPREVLLSIAQEHDPNISETVLDTYLGISKRVSKNTFEEYGLSHWPEVNPRGVRDKAYLVLKKKGEPLHFRDITRSINEASFSNREAKPQTVHNELIKDNRFVLVGRGIYALREWGYEPGTVKDVLMRILKRAKRPLSEKELVNEVQKERMVKPETIRFNLKANPVFQETRKGVYVLKT